MEPYCYKTRVQYYDTDKMMVMHHANYIRYFETARTEYFRDARCSSRNYVPGNLMMPAS